MNTNDVTGLPVINIIDGTKVGTIAHIYLDLAAQQVVGFAIAPDGGWFGGKMEPAPTIAASAVRSLGADALTIDDLVAAHAAWVGATYGALLTVDQVAGRPVVTASGADLGHLTAVDFDAETFALTGIEVSSGMFRTTTRLPIDQLVQLDADPIVMRDAVSADHAADAGPPAAEAER
ncbi:MAG TPA: PRC-barrel domain-containing protein [Thermomicrobiales bacterium]|nr:PRC-barrel domain-containing protein [Thermomicrobiales bacterium]